MPPLIPPGSGPSNQGPSRFQLFTEFSLSNPATNVVSEEEGDWWSGIGGLGLQIALVVGLAVSSTATIAQTAAVQHQDDPAGNLTATVDEYLWDNPNKPVYVPPSQVFPDSNEQTPTLYGQYDEDFWNNPVKPYAELAIYPQQSSFDEQIPAGSLTATVDEYFWQNPAPPIYIPPWQLIASDEVIVPQAATFQPDEDFWVNPIQPYVAVAAYPQPWTFDEQYPVLYGQFDEDFWYNQVAPVTGLAAYPQPYSFDAGEIVRTAVTTKFVSWIQDDVG
jgi:hypothetical protein